MGSWKNIQDPTKMWDSEHTMTIAIIIIASLLVLSIPTTIILVHHFKNKPDFKIKCGADIHLSDKTSDISNDAFDGWVAYLVDFWNEERGWYKKDIFEAIGNSTIKIFDKKYLVEAGQKVSGAYYPGLIKITTLEKDGKYSKDRVKSLFFHEVSHLILDIVGGIDGSKHHDIFKEVNLGA